MPRLTENVLIGGRVRLAGEDISEVDAEGVRPEVFAEDRPADGSVKSSRARGKSASTK